MNRSITEKVKIYETMRIPILGGYWYRFISALEMKSIQKEVITDYPLNREIRDEIVIASLTSFPARIEYVRYAIKSLMLQTYKPDRIVLWLAEEQFPDKVLPKQLTDLMRFGLEILWTKDLYGHKKYFHLIENQKENELVITFDDDIIYPPKCIERLMKKHQEFPKCVVCERAQAINRESERLLNPGRWNTISDVGVDKPSYSLNPSPGGGCLIPYGAFHKDAVNFEKIYKLAYKNDDLWYMFMCAQNGTKIIKTRKYHKIFTLVEESQVVQMATDNVIGNKNAEIMQGLIAEYPEAWDRILNDRE